VAVVTGAAGQIGRRLLADLESRGAVVVGLDLAAACPEGDPRFVPCDVTDDDAVRAAFAEVGRRHPAGVDLLVLAAGISAIGRLGDHDLATHRRVMDVTHFGALSCLLAALPALRSARGRVVLIGSVAGFAPVLGRPPYVAAKHAVTGLFTAARPELADDGVTVTVCHPTFVTGGMTEAAARAPGAERSTSGEELTPADVSAALLDGVERGDDLVLVGRTARLSWRVSRHAPGLYTRMMLRRLGATAVDRRRTDPADPTDPARPARPGGAA
jgi:NAD(P)-dependent dehydrogenase (short-subunit alcohol dehydrogenase family)